MLFNSWMGPVKIFQSPRKPVQVQIIQQSACLNSVFINIKEKSQSYMQSQF